MLGQPKSKVSGAVEGIVPRRSGGHVIVCHCRVVNHRDIEAAIDDGARSVPEVADICGAGTHCGGCVPAIADTVARRLLETLDAVETACSIRPRVGAAA
jgi:NAD(P)H-nitrite reductase large subunit